MELKTHQKDKESPNVNVIITGRKGTEYYGGLYQHPEAGWMQQRFKGKEGRNQATVIWEVFYQSKQGGKHVGNPVAGQHVAQAPVTIATTRVTPIFSGLKEQ